MEQNHDILIIMKISIQNLPASLWGLLAFSAVCLLSSTSLWCLCGQRHLGSQRRSFGHRWSICGTWGLLDGSATKNIRLRFLLFATSLLLSEANSHLTFGAFVAKEGLVADVALVADGTLGTNIDFRSLMFASCSCSTSLSNASSHLAFGTFAAEGAL